MHRLFHILRPADAVTILSGGKAYPAESLHNGWHAGGAFLRTNLEGEELSVVLETETPIERVHLRWNRPSGPLRILGDHWERGYGDLEWRGIVPERPLPWYFIAWDGACAGGCGIMTGPNALCFWQVDSHGVSLWLDTRCGGVGFLPSGPVELCRVIELNVVEGESTFAAACRFCRLLCPRPRLPEQPVYGGNNWYFAYGNSSQEAILDDTRRIVELSPSGSNRPFMVIDDGWQQHHSSEYNGGPWGSGNGDFPDMAALAQAMHREGAQPGIWLRPLLTSLAIPQHWRMPGGRFLAGDSPMLAGPHGAILDPSIPEVLQQIREMFRTIRGWGYAMIKHDFSTYDLLGRWGHEMQREVTNDGWGFSDRAKTTAQILKGLYQTIREAVGDDTLLIGCNTVSHLSAGIFELQRTGDDTSGRLWERTRKMGVNTLAFRMPQHEAFYACDADCVGLTDNVPWDLNSQWLDLLARSGTPLFVSADPAALSKEQRQAIRNAFSEASQPRPAAEPLDWMETTCPERWRTAEGITEYCWSASRGIDTLQTY